MFTLDQFTYDLPEELIAQAPSELRDHCRLLQLDRQTGEVQHSFFYDLPNVLRPTDLIVRNNTKVIPARIFGQKPTGGHVELLLITPTEMLSTTCRWECLSKPGLKIGQTLSFENTALTATCIELSGYTRIIEFNQPYLTFLQTLDQIGHTPLPPYIHWAGDDELALRELYQTTYAKLSGSVAAPTAGLHFTPELDANLKNKGIQIEEVTLHVGMGTFFPLQDEQLKTRKLHQEKLSLSVETAAKIMAAKQEGRRIISVGTTTTRVLESCWRNDTLQPGEASTELFIQPGYKFQVVDGLITNFHLSRSSLLFLVSAFVTEPNTSHPFENFAQTPIGKAYQTAIEKNYKFFSFGDAMLIL